MTPRILKNTSEGGLLRQSITTTILGLQYVDMGISTQSCHFYENLALPLKKSTLVQHKLWCSRNRLRAKQVLIQAIIRESSPVWTIVDAWIQSRQPSWYHVRLVLRRPGVWISPSPNEFLIGGTLGERFYQYTIKYGYVK